MSAASRVKPEEFFSPDEWRALSARSSWKGIALVLHCWLVIGAAMAVGMAWPLTIPLMVMVIGNRQLGLFILMHDAAHGLLHANRQLNDRVALWLCDPGLNLYRPYHLQHHRFVQQTEDPDLVLSAPFPVTRESLRRKILRDLSGRTFYKQRFGMLSDALKARRPDESAWAVIAAELKRQRVFFICNGLGLALFSAAGFWWAWVLMWLLPMATWLPLVSRLRNIAEHALIVQNGTDPLRHARTTHASLLERLFIAPYWVNYHCEHHMFTQVPCWNLPRAHRLLQAQGVTARMEVQPGYLTVLRLASSSNSH
ncbi:MAG: fatty acid desaturase family protein [Pseudomonadota bacterium]